MKNKINISIILLLFGMFLFQTSCVDKSFSEPEFPTFKYELKDGATLISIAELKGMLSGDLTKIDTNVVIRGTVIANGQSGNYYKMIVIQDSTADGIQTGIEIGLNSYGLHNVFPIGQMVYVECKGLYLGTYGYETRLGSNYNDAVGRIEEALISSYFFKDDAGLPIKPKLVKLSELTLTPVNTLIQVDNAQFKLSELSRTFADATNKVDGEIQLEDETDEAIVMTSGYANFATKPIPPKNGSVIMVYSRYKGNTQLFIRDYNEINFNQARTDNVVFLKDFGYPDLFDAGTNMLDGFISGKWTSYAVIGNVNWMTGSYDGNSYGNISNYNSETGSKIDSEAWFISPAFDLTKVATPILNFKTATDYTGAVLKLKVSTDYSGSGDPTLATWTELSFTPSPTNSDFDWTASGDVNLSDYKTTSTYIAYVYTGTESDGATWEVDDISITNATK